tara:strand:+ start:818 stop:1447 length:630 start_codon:yes stop_codon:yes gene_type:complete
MTDHTDENEPQLTHKYALIQALLEAQKTIENAIKASPNDFFKSKYANIESVLATCKEAFNDQGVLIQQKSHPSDTGVIVETIFYGHGAHLSAGKVHVPAKKDDPQAYGSAYTYARRYSLKLAANIGDKDDDGEGAMGAIRKYKLQDAFKRKVTFSTDDPAHYLKHLRDLAAQNFEAIYKANQSLIELASKDAKGETADGFSKLKKLMEG